MHKIIEILNKILKREKSLPYSKLSPKSDIEDKEKYFEALKWAIDNKEMHNIAITGPYGSGKSSIINSFFKKNKRIKKLSISMASFNGEKMTKEEIEKSILQQLFYKVKDKKIHYSRFKKINNEKKRKTIFIILITLALFATIGYSGLKLFNPTEYSNIESYYKYLNDIYKTRELIKYVLIFIASSLIVIYSIVRYIIKRIKLSKIKIKDVEINIENSSNESIFNKYLDEIIYFFEVTKYRVVIFEDLDRLNNKDILIKLRELNNLLNNSEIVNRNIAFIYAVKDDVFVNSAERTKFFDFILPIIPFINSNNSKEILVRKLEEMKISINEEFNLSFLDNISIYINDMRILSNICNEFYIYKNNLLDSIELQKLFAIIVYKNLLPTGFEELQNNKGSIYNIFSNKDEIISNLNNELDNEINELKDKKKNIEKENIQSMQELKKYIIGELAEKVGIYDDKLVINSSNYSIKQIMDETFDINNFYDTTIKRYSYGYPSCKFDELLDGKILSRIENIKNNEENKKRKLLEEINTKIENKNRIAEMKISEIINEFTFDYVINKDKYGEIDDLTRYLIGNGYIDENYEDYINYFYEGSLNKADKVFIQKVNAQRKIEYDYPIKNKENVIKIIDKPQFKSKSILNFDVLQYLLNNKSYNDKRDILVDNIIDESKESKDFIIQYIKYNKSVDKFINEICKKWHEIWKYIDTNEEFIDKQEYLINILKFANIDDLISIDEITALNKVINEYPDLINYFKTKEEIDKLKEIFKNIEIKISNISEKCASLEIFDYIKDEKYYEINIKMVKTILNKKMTKGIENIDTQNYTCILNSNDSIFILTIEENIEKYVKEVFLKLNTNTKEDEDSIIKLINNSKISEELKEEILQKEEIIFENISVIETKYWKLLLHKNKIKPTWNNVIKYYEQYEMDNDLIEFLNTNIEISAIKINSSDEELNKKISLDIMNTENLNVELVQAIKYTYNRFDFSKISRERSKKILKYRKINCTLETYNSLRENYKDMTDELVKNDIYRISKDSKYEFDNEDIFVILNDNMIGLKDKVELIKNRENTIECRSKEEAERVADILLKTKSQYIPTAELLNKVFIYRIPQDNKIKILTKYIESLIEEEIGTLLSNIGYPYSEIPQKNKNPYIQLDDILLNKIRKFSYVSKIKPERNGYRIYKKREN